MSEQVTANGRFVDKHTIEFDLHYDHPRSLVWKAITDPESLAVWMMPMELDLRVGGPVSLDPGKGRAVGVITALEPEALLEYRFDDGQAFWPESVLRWELSDDDDEHGPGCRLRFTQRLGAGVDFSPGQIAGPGTFHPGTGAGWEGFFAEGLTRFLDRRTTKPIYDESDDRLMAARTPIYRRRLVEAFGDATIETNRAERVDPLTMRHTRWYAHPVERVWEAITDGEQAALWHGWPVSIDLRVGGHAVFGPPAEPYWEADVVVLEPPHRIEFSHPAAAPAGGAIRYELAEEGGGTRMTFTQWFLPSDESPWRADFVGGFHGMFDLLGWVLDGEPVDRDPWRWRDVLVPAYEEFLSEA